MLKHKRLGIVATLMIVSIAISVFLVRDRYRHYQNQIENQFKNDYKKGDKVAALQDLLGSDRYAKDLRKAGYTIPDNGAIQEDGLIASVTINDGNQKITIGSPGEGSDSFLVTVRIKDRPYEDLDIVYSLDKDLNQDSELDIWKNGKDVTEEVSISSSEENNQLTKIRKEVNDFLDTMYNRIYK